jgi:hypothetical protein
LLVVGEGSEEHVGLLLQCLYFSCLNSTMQGLLHLSLTG